MSRKTLTEQEKASTVSTLRQVESMLDKILMEDLRGKLKLIDADMLNLLTGRVAVFRYRINGYPSEE